MLESLKALFGRAAEGKEMPPPKTKFEFASYGSEDETLDDDGDWLAVLECLGRSFAIQYLDSKGQKSQRVFTITSMTPQSGDILLKAFVS